MLSRTGLVFAVSPSTGKTKILKMSRKWQYMILLVNNSDEKWWLFQKQFNNWTLKTLNRRTSRDAACTMIIGKDAPLGPSCVKVDLYDNHWSAFYDETAFIWAFFLIWRRFFFPSIVVSRVAQMIKVGNRHCILCTRLTSNGLLVQYWTVSILLWWLL